MVFVGPDLKLRCKVFASESPDLHQRPTLWCGSDISFLLLNNLGGRLIKFVLLSVE
jgi:hypothetical protein